MVYTEVKKKKGRNYYYRVISIREKNKVNKKRIYLGVNLKKDELQEKEQKADKELKILTSLLTKREIKELDKIKKRYSSQPLGNKENRYEAFCSLFTYNSTAIEGNTLNLRETSSLLFEKITPSAKPLREINEIANHKEAFDLILNKEIEISKKTILNIHKIVAKNTLRKELENQVGKYRELQVYIRGVDWIPPKPQDVPKEMKTLLLWYSKNKRKLHPVILAAYFHSAFETIHPFVDGNGRVGRLLINLILHKKGYPMINIPNSRKNNYYAVLQEAQIKANLRPIVLFFIELLKEEEIIF